MRARWSAVAGLIALLTAVPAPVARAGDDPFWSDRTLLPRPHVQVPDFSHLAALTLPSVVSITTVSSRSADRFHALMDGEPPGGSEKGMGSGFVIRPDGLIVTNAHVVDGARSIRVTLDDGPSTRSLPAAVIGIDEATDVALLRVHPGHPLPALPLGDSDAVKVGQWVVAEGNPFGLSHSVTFGVISYVGRNDVSPEGHDGFRDYLQTDASINPGSSGGPLLDLRGRVVGIANAVNPAGQGIGFAVPINMAKAVLPALRARGRAERAWMGVRVQDITPELAESFGLTGQAGVLVSDMDEAGPAANAGLHPGDVIVRFGGRPIRHAQHLRWLAAIAPVGRPVPVDVRRDGALVSLSVVMAPAPRPKLHAGGVDLLGARFAQLDVPAARSVGLALPNGAQVVGLGEGTAKASGLRVGDVVTRVGQDEVDSPEELARALHAAPTGPVNLTVRRGRARLTVPVRNP